MHTKTESVRPRAKKSSAAEFPFRLERGSSHVTIYQHRDDRGYAVYTLAYYLEGQRRRPTFASFADAKAEADFVLDRLNQGESAVLTLTTTDRLAYLRAREVLDKHGVPLDVAASQFAHALTLLNGSTTLTDAVTGYLKMRPASIKTATVQQVVDELLVARKADGSSPRHIDDLDSRLNRFAEAFQCPMSGVTASDIHDFLLSLKLKPRTCNNFRTAISNLFSFARLKNYVPRDHQPLEQVPELKEPSKPVPILTRKELLVLLEHVTEEFLPYMVIGAFAGLRQSELARLNWTHIGPKYIKVPPAAHRVKSTRLVAITPNLKRWLSTCRKVEGKVVPFSNVSNQITQLFKKAGLKSKHNSLRHSFGSYRVAVAQDPKAVSFEMGNSPKMVMECYREVVTPEEGRAWFRIMPGAAKNILALKPQCEAAQPESAASHQ